MFEIVSRCFRKFRVFVLYWLIACPGSNLTLHSCEWTLSVIARVFDQLKVLLFFFCFFFFFWRHKLSLIALSLAVVKLSFLSLANNQWNQQFHFDTMKHNLEVFVALLLKLKGFLIKFACPSRRDVNNTQSSKYWI